MTEQEQAESLEVLANDLEVFCAHCMKIKTKSGSMVPFIWNKAQQIVHEMLEKQLRETGKVRALVLKYRQGGISTYIAARFYHKATTQEGQNVFVVAHEQKATDNLFSMVKRYHDYNPLPVSTGNTNAKELIFDKLEGGYKLATAGTKDVGRSNTAQMLHGSEYAFWANAQMHLAGIGSTIADVDGTEIILESTANGLGNSFHELWQAAEAGQNEWLPIFLPWFIQPEYRAKVRPDLELTAEDIKYQQAYGLDMEQMQWRANKISTYGKGFEWLFSQEFPATAAEAFQTSTQNPLISPNDVMEAVNSGYRDRSGPLIIGCDPAEEGADRTAIVFRQGRTVFRMEYHERKRTMQIAGILARYWQEFKPDAMFIDRIGIGAGIYDRLLELNIPVIGVHSGERANESDIYENKRAEMWWLMKEWIEDHPNRLPKDAALIADLIAPQPKVTSKSKRLLESKADMKKRGIRSPDGGDALALTFAEPVVRRDENWGASSGGYKPATRVGY